MIHSAPRIGSLWDMLSTNASWFIRALNNIGFCEGVLEAGTGIGAETSTSTADQLRQMVAHMPPADVPATIASAKLVLHAWSQEGGINKVRLRVMLEAITQNLQAELSNRTMWLMSRSEHEIYKIHKKPFGSLVYDTIPSIRDDIDEAAVCLSMSRNVASVFHLMRAMEECVGLISEKLTGIQKRKVWGILLSDIKCAVDKMPKGIPKTRWLHAHSLLYSVKEAWRNDVMHPNKVYAGEQAREIFDTTKAFVGHLASLLRPDLEAA